MEETQLQEEGVAEKRPRTERSDTETKAAGGEAERSITVALQEGAHDQHISH